MINPTQARWLWYPGDFEIRQGLLQNFSREERSYDWPAYWNIDDCHKNIKFKRFYNLHQTTSFIVYAVGQGYVEVNEKKYPLNSEIICHPGNNKVRVFVGNSVGLPSIYIEGEIIKSDIGWLVSNFIEEFPAGWSKLYLKRDVNPNETYFETVTYQPINVLEKKGGLLLDYGRAIFGTLRITKLTKNSPVTICYGESEEEALDVEMCYYKEEDAVQTTKFRKRAFRYLYIPEVSTNDIMIEAIHEYLPIVNQASFQSDNSLLNEIWNVSVETFSLCSGLFFIDGIKRDRWIWSGDAYQSYFINQYLFFDEDINTRTMWALRGQNEIKQHMNTIVDYSMLWIIGIENHYMMTGDKVFLEQIYPKMKSMMNYLQAQTNELGFIYGREKDWIFIDWSEMDKEGTLAAEQVLLLKAYNAMILCGEILEKDVSKYKQKFVLLKENLFKYFWDEEQGAFIDSYLSGKKNVTRHANIFAILFDFVDEQKADKILNQVLLNDNITQITTPYFKFFEQDALCKLGQTNKVYQIICDYWGGMIEQDATTFWEEYIPEERGSAVYEMYGDPFGKSLCHAWGASPIYLLGRYFAGIKPTSPGYETFTITPNIDLFNTLECTFPVKSGTVKLRKQNNLLFVTVSRSGGTMIVADKVYSLESNKEYCFNLTQELVTI